MTYYRTPGSKVTIERSDDEDDVIRNHFAREREEVEKALQGQQNAQAALDSVVQRGNRVLREFEKSVRT